MVTSTIYLWQETGLTPSLNYAIDNIWQYLNNNFTKSDLEDYQFVEFKPKMSIRVDMNQYNLQFDADYDYDYCGILREGFGFDEATAYYFITNKKWISANCIEFELEMDVLNSFTWNEDYTVSPKTLVKREHVNRFSSVVNHSYTSNYINLPANTTVNITVQTALMSFSRIKSVGDIYLISGSGVTFTKTVNPGYVVIGCTSATAQRIKFFFTYELYCYMTSVDMKSENIHAPMYKSSEMSIQDAAGTTWSLLYKNQNNPDPDDLTNPVDCFLYPGSDLKMYVPNQTNTIVATDAPTSGWLYILGPLNAELPSFEIGTTVLTLDHREKPTVPSDGTSVQWNVVALHNNSGTLQVRYATVSTYKREGTTYHTGSWTPYVGNIRVNSSAAALYGNHPSATAILNFSQVWSLMDSAWNDYIDLQTTLEMSVFGKDHIDRTDSKNIKLITLPYCPSQCSYINNGSLLTIGNEWILDNNILKLNDLNTKFKNEVVSKDIFNPVSDLVFNTYQVLLDGTATKTGYDPKLYHSDFYYKKFTYDSFNKVFKLELLDWDGSLRANGNSGFTMDFITSRNIVSKFLFMFPQYVLRFGEEDYDNVLPVARNNEEVLYNSQYLNYLRTGYNYDLKTKERQETAGAAGLGLSAAALAASIGISLIPGMQGVGVAGVIGSVAGIAGSAINYAKATAQAEDNIQRKLQESQNQAVSVLNADDYDLLEAYSNNQAKICTYEVSPQMHEALSDLFFYCGYARDFQEVPNIDTRYWFNFLQCDLVCDNWDNIPKEIQEMIKQKFSEGVTFFHCHKLGSDTKYTWDIGQTKENYEKWIVLANGGNN